MFDKPLEGILHRDYRKAENADQLRLLSKLFTKMVNYGTHAIGRSVKSRDNKPHESFLAILFYRHIIEMFDAVEVLISQSIFEPISLQLRSSFEALLYMQYILEDDTQRRSRSYFYVKGMETSRWRKIFKPSSEARKRILAELEKDKTFVKIVGIPTFQDVDNRIAEDEQCLNNDDAREIKLEYERKKQKKCGKWHALFSDYDDLEIMARKLGKIGIYKFHYHWLSEVMHAESIHKALEDSRNGTRSIKQLRLADKAEWLVKFAVYIWYESTKMLLEYFREEELPRFEANCKKEIYSYFTNTIRFPLSRE